MFTFKPKLGVLLGAALALTSSYNSYGQTIIDYSTFSSAACNVFASPVSVGGVEHVTTAGQPRYDAANQSIDLDYIYYAGTEYGIKYPFKKGYSYQIIVNAWSVQSPSRVGAPPTLRCRISNGSPSSPFCTGPTFVGPTADVHQSQMGVNDLFFNDHIFSSFNSTSDFNYLLLAALPNTAATHTGTIFIRKVTIKVISRAEFQLTPSSVDVMCGAQPNYTFTVNNPSGISGVTSYVWNVGATPNGWIYGGAVAPATITTATNSLSLKSVCGVAPKNISVTVYVGGSVYNTYSSVVNLTSWPSLSIVGDDEICPGSSATYTIPNLPCDASVKWSEVSGLVSISTVDNIVTLNNPLTSGKVAKLKAMFTSCGKNISLSKDITLGVINKDSLFINFWMTLPLCPMRYVTMVFINQPFNSGSVEYKWSFERGYWTIYGDDTRSSISFRPNVKYVADILQVKAKNKCGWSNNQFLYLYVKNCTSIPVDPILNNGPLTLLLSPNPANKEVKLSFNKENSDNLFFIKGVEIMNGFGILKKELVFDKNETMQSIDISDLSPGLYIVKVFDGQFWRVDRLVVE